MTTFEYDAVITLQATFILDDVATDPTSVTLRIIDPNGGVNIYTTGFTHDDTGIYKKAVECPIAGKWYYRFEGTGAVHANAESSFEIASSMFYPVRH